MSNGRPRAKKGCLHLRKGAAIMPGMPSLKQALSSFARDLGFDAVAIAPAGPSPDHDRYVRWVEAGYGGAMEYLVRHSEAKSDRRALLAEAQSVILVGLNYTYRADPTMRRDPSRGPDRCLCPGPRLSRGHAGSAHRVGRLAAGADGTQQPRSRLCRQRPGVGALMGAASGPGVRRQEYMPDSPRPRLLPLFGGPLVPERLDPDEPPRRLGGASATDVDQEVQWRLAGDAMGTCGRCTRSCLDACPTGAFVSPLTVPIPPAHLLPDHRAEGRDTGVAATRHG